MPETPIRIGIAGLGRSGWPLHALTTGQHPAYRVAAVADPLPERREEARSKFGCAAYADPEGLLGDPSVEVVTIATPSHTHAPLAIAALQAGKHVVVEKPMAQNTAEMDAMIAAAARAGRVLTCFMPLRWQAAFVALRDLIGSGRLGRVVLIRRTASNFTRRADWQTLRRFGGGELSNNGPHFLDQVLHLMDAAAGGASADGESIEVFADLQHTIGAGDAEDHVKVVLKNGHGTVADIEASHCDAFPGPEWTVLGTGGGVQGGSQELRVRWCDTGSLPALTANEGPAAGRAYGTGEKLEWHEETLRPKQERTPYAQFYDALAGTLRGGAPLAVTPESVRRHIDIIERARQVTGMV